MLSCVLKPGQQLREKDLVERFSVSKSPVRDALLKLETQGLVEVLPRRGYRVRRIDVSDVRDMYGLRHVLERECTLMLIDTASDSILRELEQYRSAPDCPALADWITYNRAFHSHIARYCGNRRLGRITCETLEQFDRLTYVSVSQAADLSLDTFVAEHGQLIDAIRERNRRRAARLTREHIEASRRRVLDSLEAASIIDTNPANI